MAVTDWWLGRMADGTPTVVCRSDTDATVSITCNGATYTGQARIGVRDGLVEIPVTGLPQSGQRYRYFIDGVVDGGSIKSGNRSGEYWIAAGSCWAKSKPDVLAYDLLNNYDIDYIVALGDLPYANTGVNSAGLTTTSVTSSVDAGKSANNYYLHHRQARRANGIRELIRNVPLLYTADDHEYPMDNAAPQYLTKYQSGVTGAGTATQADLDAAWTAARAGVEAYSLGNPANTDAGVDADAVYGRITVGPVEIILLDSIHYRSSPDVADNSAKTMLGATQQTWVINAVNNSTAPFKMICSGKTFWATGANEDTYVPRGVNPGYTTARNALLQQISNATGVFVAAGDQHLWGDTGVSAGDIGAGYPAMSCMVCSPVTSDLNPTGITGYPAGTHTKIAGYASSTSGIAQDNVYGLFRVTQNRVERYLLSRRNGLMSMGYIEAGSNAVRHD